MSKKNIKDFNIEDVLEELSKRRPIFHNERDFQFEFAWLIKDMYDCDIRHEHYNTEKADSESDKAGRRIYIDLIAYSKDYCIAFELKYKTKVFNDEINGEKFDLKNQSAQDFGCAYVLSDLSRTEKLIGKEVNGKVINKGYIVFLTNDPKYKKGFKKGSLFENFSLIENSEIKGEIKFVSERPIEETVANKLKEIDFTYNNTYKVIWGDYNKKYNNNYPSVFSLVFEIPNPNTKSK